MGSARTQVIRFLALLTAFAVGSGCRTPRPGPEPFAAPMVEGIALAAAPSLALTAEPLPAELPAAERALDGPGLVITSRGWRVPDTALDPGVAAAVRDYVERGGRVLLLGYAAACAARLGLESSVPEALPFRHGFDATSSGGAAHLGIRALRDDAAGLWAGMQPTPGSEDRFRLAGGAPCAAARCAWSSAPPARGEVLAELVVEADGSGAAVGPAPVLVRWRLGRGAVLALGLEPEAANPEPRVAANARALLANATRWLIAGHAPRQLPCWVLSDPAPPALPSSLLPAIDRPVPGAAVVPHWGFVLPPAAAGTAAAQRDRAEQVVLQAWQAAGDLVALPLVDGDRACVLPWGARDLLARPKTYAARADADAFQPLAFAALVADAHARGMLVQGAIEAMPVGERAAERLALTRFLARSLGDRRRLGSGALDGLLVRDWIADRAGLGTAMLQDFQPTARLVLPGERNLLQGGGTGALDAADGQVPGLAVAGLTDSFRGGPPADLAPLGLLDATLRCDAAGRGGSGGDWIAIQAADFARARRAGGAAMLWRTDAFDRGADAATLAYVAGVSAEPLVAAVAARCSTIGTDGWRDAQRQLLTEPLPGLGAELAVPAETVLLQNNHIRLCGSSGALLLDPAGLARFRAGEPAVLGREFLRTRIAGIRPVAGELRLSEIDLLASGRQPRGGQPRTVQVKNGVKPPEGLAFRGGELPQRVEFALDCGTGSFSLDLELRARDGQGVVAVGVDEGVRVVLPFQRERLSIRRALPLQLATRGTRTLWLEVQDGGEVALDRLQLTRTGDVATEAEPVVPAGSVAVARERCASSYHQEAIEFATAADFAGFLLRTDCSEAARNLRVERRFDLPAFGAIRVAADGDSPQSLRRPFVLASSDPALPDLCVVPLRLGRADRFELRADGLRLLTAPEAGAGTRIGFAFVPRAAACSALAELSAVFAELDQPTRVALGADGRATLGSPARFAWPRLLQIERRTRTPFLVCEGGWWTWRSTQSMPDGRELLRLWQLPGANVQLLAGADLLASTRPGPGSLRAIALRDPAPRSVTVCVLAADPLATPSVVLSAPFDSVALDGRPWSHHEGTTVWLPNRPGIYRVTTASRGGPPTPHVVACSAALDECAFDPTARVLLLAPHECAPRPAALPHTAILAGPAPVRVDGGEVVDDDELRFASRAERAAAAERGVLIRFRGGPVRVHYADE